MQTLPGMLSNDDRHPSRPHHRRGALQDCGMELAEMRPHQGGVTCPFCLQLWHRGDCKQSWIRGRVAEVESELAEANARAERLENLWRESVKDLEKFKEMEAKLDEARETLVYIADDSSDPWAVACDYLAKYPALKEKA